MGQEEILNLLKQHPDKWYSVLEIAEATNSSAQASLSRMTMFVQKRRRISRGCSRGFEYKLR